MLVSRRYATILAVLLPAAGLMAAGAEPPDDATLAADAIQDGYETDRPSWQQEYTDTTVRLLAHERSDRAAHGGRTSERFRFEAGQGSRFFVSEALPKIPVTPDLAVSVYVRSNRTGAQIFGWVVLPEDIDPETKAPSFLLVPGSVFSRPDRWEKLTLAEMLPAIEEQARVLRASTRRAVPLKGAYLERVVVNLMAGMGETDVFLDDLRVAPVPPALAAAWSAGRSPAAPAVEGAANARPKAQKAGAVKDQGELALPRVRLTRGKFERLVGGERYLPWFPTAIEAPGADPVALRRHGFDVLVTGPEPDLKRIPPLLEGEKPMFLLPRLSGATEEGGPQRVLREISEYPLLNSVMMWSIGEHLGRLRESAARIEEVQRIREVLAALDQEDIPHLATATVDNELRLYTRPPANLDVVGIELPLWGTMEGFMEGLAYLRQRRDITARTNLEAVFWAWLPVTTPEVVTRNIWGTDEVPPWGTPPVQPEQLRLMTYMALAGGCRGLTFVGDADLTRPAREPLLLEMGFLNAEIDLFEGILAGNIAPISNYSVFDPDPPDRPTVANVNQKRMPLLKEFDGKPGLYAAAIPLVGSKGALLLVADFEGSSQFQPAQMAYHDLVISPRLPQGVQFLEVSPGEARFLEQKTDDRVPGGTRVTIPEFGVSTMILCTTDIALCERVQRDVQRIRPMAAQWAIRQADLQFALARDGHERLKVDGHLINGEEELKTRRLRGIDGRPPDADDLLVKAEEFLKSARAAYELQDYSTAWNDARRATRPLRKLMFDYWSQAMAEINKATDESLHGKTPKYRPGEIRPFPHPPLLTTAASFPPAVSFYSLPQLHIWKDWIKGVPGYRFGANRVPSGSFDDADKILSAGWTDISHQCDGIVKKITVPKREPIPVAKNDPKKKARTATTTPKKSDIKYEDEQIDEDDHVLKLSVEAADPKKVDELDPYLDEPAAAVLSPPVRVGANNLIRISVIVKRPLGNLGGKAGLIIRDSIGGEQFQFRTGGPIPAPSRVVLYRKAPADGTLRVMLALAGYGEVYFDDFQVQVIEEDIPYRPVDPGLVQETRPDRASPRLPDPRTPAAAAAVLPSSSRRER
jgi:hypothetical protein